MRVAFTNLGCKLNQAELEELARAFDAAGHQVVGSIDRADLHVINSCTVTHAAARDSRKTARRGARRNPAVRTVLTGCYVESDPGAAARLAGVDLVVGNAEKERLLDEVERRFPDLAARPAAEPQLPCAALEFGNARALVKVEDGCNMPCAFCIIPQTRGRQRSRPVDEVVARVRELVARGFSEVVLTGVQISSYRSPEGGLYELAAAVLERTTVERLRLSSIAPWQFDRRLLELVAGGRVCRHFHLSLQSGDAETLARMRRPYSPDRFRELVDTVRSRIPDVAITTDVIVGFPGESDAAFDRSLAFVDAVGFARVHAFPFSPRPGTEAASMAGAVDAGLVRERMRRMLDVADRAQDAFARSQVGITVDVLWERQRSGRWRGTSDNYLRVETDDDRDLGRRVTPALLVEAGGPWMRAEVAVA